ncbi:hypothetical protein [Paraburkholderia sp. J7]|uniref:hypothetical protein n=1 Tax=Paraburkholderia sp. J7 TaxID=2805438 RepID=UPI002AB6AD09|nr:hypothetical protein [Paraburkholderia sp. J7]
MDASGRFRRSANVNAIDASVPALSASTDQSGLFCRPDFLSDLSDKRSPPCADGRRKRLCGPPCARRIPSELFPISFEFFSFTVMSNG